MVASRDLPLFRRTLLTWFREFQRDLPWRRSPDAYRVWLSEIMLQQTRVTAVIPYYRRFLERFPDVAVLASAPEEDLLALWSGLGYYRRARNLQRAAQQIVLQHRGIFPHTKEEVLALPGVGPYTAAAILSISSQLPLAAVDGNVARVMARLGAVRGDPRDPACSRQLEKCATRLLDAEFPGDWNQAMMELGAVVCTPRAPQCCICPVAKFCRARRLGLAESLPHKRPKRARVQISLAAAVLLDSEAQTVLLPPPRSGRKQGKVAALVSKMWHFPSTAVGSSPARELREFLTELLPYFAKRQAWQLEGLPMARHAVTFREITVLPFRVALGKLPRIPGARIVPLSEIAAHSSLAVSSLTRKVARAAMASARHSAACR